MSWLFSSKGSRPLPPLTSLQQQKQRQIDSLRACHSSVAEIQKDVEYRLPITVKNITISLNILLPPQFPQEKPHISVFPPIRHHLVDKQGINVICPLVNNFTMHSDLGKIVQTLVEELWKNPPTLASSSGSFPYIYGSPAGQTSYAHSGFQFLPSFPTQESNRSLPVSESVPANYNASKSAAPPYGLITELPLPVPTSEVGINGYTYKMPDLPDPFPELTELSATQLSEMMEQEDLLLEQFVNLPQLKQIISDKEDLVRNIEDIAKKNLQLEPILESKRQAILDKYELLTQMKATFEKKLQRQHELSESCSLSALQARLKVAAHEAEEESDSIAEDFLEGKIEIEDFLNVFMEKRTCCHSRRAKEEKLQQAISLYSQYHAPL
ncbi:LOW QUALITY PROTEIN: vacuolar protein sorting-associated protein 37A [Bombina bombina]|uniref:LOW QUALITY PROTEIN: vacuolar protein sorting-associated protein 37A n=1 Tax=Bombina bombina TaxID=8345 RepID=UPI00235A8396|nr:LOW QUALITY PROTEIN: vacuolar protein sorting-associated protein 37A [Bombina bombina]